MKRVTYYISDYGYGHATRNVAIIRALLRKRNDLEIVICHSYALEFLKQSFIGESRVFFRNLRTDVGYILKERSIEPNVKRLEAALSNHYKYKEPFIEREKLFYQEKGINAIITDISPLPIEAAFDAKIPSIGISNFTWHTAYQGLIQQSLLQLLQASYEKLSYFFAVACGKERYWGRVGNKNFGFYAREIDLNKVKAIREKVNPDHNKTLVFFGLGMKMNISINELTLWNSLNCEFIVSSNVDIDLPNVTKIPEKEIESQNYIAAADIVITKAGWGTVSEAIAGKTPLLIIDRKGMQEDQNTIDYLQEHKLCKTIEWGRFKNIVITDDLVNELNQIQFNTWYNDADKIALSIIDLLK